MSVIGGIEFVGGPLCGQSLMRSKDPGLYTFTDGKRCFKRPGKHRALYRRLEPRGELVVYLYVGNRVGLCRACGSYNQFPDGERRCTMCGHALAASI